ncbi:MAG: pyridoxal phosphate-dependent aminotransferase [Bacteroidales bacterium]|nr:pyridoxal phosphate-dependent aminotransferase [Bacteroidales bacterium]
MKYDFESLTPRRGTNCVKWDLAPSDDIIPMWVADMDFKVAPFIVEALQRRLDHNIYGYVTVPGKYYDALCSWFDRRYGWKIDRSLVQYTIGVVPAISVAVHALAGPGEGVIFQTPAYNCFFSSVRNQGTALVESPLRYVEKDGRMTYEMDFEDLEKKASDPNNKVFLLCNPHNPAGRCWTREELRKVGEICHRHGVTVVSDEIHCEIVMPGHEFVPYATVSEELAKDAVILNSPSKSFNTAGLQLANIICGNKDLCGKIEKVINVFEVCDVNPFGVEALMAAYGVPGDGNYPVGPGEEWLRQMNAAVYENYKVLCEALAPLKKFKVCTLEGTYLAWVDCRATGLGGKQIQDILLNDNKVWVNGGAMYGDDNFFRVNLACPPSLAEEGIRRIAEGLSKL